MNRSPLLFIALAIFAVAALIVTFAVLHSTLPASRSAELGEAFVRMLPLLFVAVAALSFVIWVWGLIHMLRNPGIRGEDRIVWTIVIVFLHAAGAVIYFIANGLGFCSSREQRVLSAAPRTGSK
jgi:hypothetical protein